MSPPRLARQNERIRLTVVPKQLPSHLATGFEELRPGSNAGRRRPRARHPGFPNWGQGTGTGDLGQGTGGNWDVGGGRWDVQIWLKMEQVRSWTSRRVQVEVVMDV